VTTPTTVLIAIGGNSLIRESQRGTIAEQFENSRMIARQIGVLVAAGWRVIVTHGNGPQVGFILLRSELVTDDPTIPRLSLDMAVADVMTLVTLGDSDVRMVALIDVTVVQGEPRTVSIQLPPGYELTWGGEFENQQRAMKRLAIIVPISTFLIFILLFDAFKSVTHALLILVNVPLGLIGGIFALLLTTIPLSVSAAIGFIALFGQAVLNGVVMVSYFTQLQDEGLSPYNAVIQGAGTRLRTVMMTALLAMLGLLPMALSHGIGSETQRPLAIVIIGGLISATILTLIVLPTLYFVLERRRQTRRPATLTS
jgi:multidrug efflux pump subunit AcrB